MPLKSAGQRKNLCVVSKISGFCEKLAFDCHRWASGFRMKILHRFLQVHRPSFLPYRGRLKKTKNSSFLATLTTQGSPMAFSSRKPVQDKASKNCKVLYISANSFWSGFLCQLWQWINRLNRGDFMHEVKVYDSYGNLKKVISVQKLIIRSKKQLELPFLFRKNKRTQRPLTKLPKSLANTGI